MSAVTDIRPVGNCSAQRAANRVQVAGAGLAALGVACLGSVLLRLTETWHVTPAAAAHHVTVAGIALSYPAANLDAIVVLALAALGLASATATLAVAGRELWRSRRFLRDLEPHVQGRFGVADVIDDSELRAFCAGLLHPRIFVTTGAVERLDAQALTAVLDHERHHARRHDPLRLAAARVLAASLFFVPGVRGLVRRHIALAELSADEHAAAAPGGAPALARAMLAFADGDPQAVGFDSGRIDHLLGEARPWRFPAALCACAVTVLVAVAAVGVLAGQLAAGSATLAPPFLSAQPCVVVLAAITAAGLAGAAACVRRANRNR